jgi:selenide,water dikinase
MDIKLTQYSHGAGCGCKISPKVLDEMLAGIRNTPNDTDSSRLLVGNGSKDDAAVYDLGDGTAVISTTDFFMPIVDDAFNFGCIAAVNAISDVYAMGGSPMLAIAILGWPVNKLPASVASKVLEGARYACAQANILLAGGHSIDTPEPVFGLAVTGRVDIPDLKRNDTATEGCLLYLTKPLGIGVLTTAEKKGLLQHEHKMLATSWMTRLNNAGTQFGKLPYVKAMTDVTGFGLLGHLGEMCDGSGLSARISYSKVPVIAEALKYIAQGAVPGGTSRNWESYGATIELGNEAWKPILADPQTSGGLLVAVESQHAAAFELVLQQLEIQALSFGNLIAKDNKSVYVIE